MKRLYLERTSFSARVLDGALVCASVLGGALVARGGTLPPRILGGALVCGVVLLLSILRIRQSRRLRKPTELLRVVLGKRGRAQAERSARAYRLWERLSSEEEPHESPELARIHLGRVLNDIQPKMVQEVAGRVRARVLLVALGLLFGVALLLSTQALRVLEGVDVLFARKGIAPFALDYVDRMQVTAKWPAYLDGPKERRFVTSRLTSVPQGSEIEVRVVPLVEKRKLLLTDGAAEVPFLSDGHGGLVARWTAEDPSELRVAVRFGDVLVYDDQSTRLTPVQDRPPQVALMGAPTEKQLEEIDRLPLQFFAHDDHGLSQIDLVVESGQRSERSELAHLDGQGRVYRGGHTLTRDHDILKKAFLPVRVRIEARDGNTATGPSWGRSKEIVLIPKPLGKDTAERHIALREFRKALAQYYASHVRAGTESQEGADAARREAHQQLVRDFGVLEERISETSGAPENSFAFVQAQVEALARTGPERTVPKAVLLAVDALIHRIAGHEAAQLSKDLGAAVEELAVQTRELRFHSEGVSRQGLLDLFEGVSLGADQLHEVGTLGLDLGSVARADLARIGRSLDLEQYERAEGAAIHLAERLKRANSSFSSSGGGVESGTPSPGQGGGKAMPGGQGQGASEAPEQFQELAQKIDQLAQESAEELTELEQLMQEAASAAAADFSQDEEAAQSSQELRDAMRRLPSTGFGPGSPRSEAAAARAEGESMADALEGANFKEAIERGRNAEAALERAERLSEMHPGWLDSQSLKDAKEAVADALAQAEKAEQALRQKTQNEQQKGLQERSERRADLAERAEELAKKGRDPEAPLPTESIDALKRAAQLLRQSERELRAGKLQEGRDSSERAQAELERALPQPQDGSSSSSDGKDSDGEGSESRHGSVPDEEKDRARDFRERVERGLAKGGGRLSPAVRRYAEDLK